MTLKFPPWMVNLSNHIDDTFFPLPATKSDLQLLHEHQKKVEETAAAITRHIIACKSIAQSYTVHKMIVNMKKLYGNTTQVCSWVDSLSLNLYNKQKDLLNNL